MYKRVGSLTELPQAVSLININDVSFSLQTFDFHSQNFLMTLSGKILKIMAGNFGLIKAYVNTLQDGGINSCRVSGIAFFPAI